jgi:hypothetical protein
VKRERTAIGNGDESREDEMGEREAQIQRGRKAAIHTVETQRKAEKRKAVWTYGRIDRDALGAGQRRPGTVLRILP